MKREPVGQAYIRAAIERIVARGKPLTSRADRGELLRTRSVGASYTPILVELRRWKREQEERASGRIEAAVDAILALRAKHERDKVRADVLARSGGGIVVRFAVRKPKPTKST